MAFDQAIRNRLARFVADTRSLLTEEFTRQLQNEYGLDPISGEVAPLENLTHLDDAHRETASLLRETMTHYLASADCSTPAKEKKARQDVLNRIVREQAFTVLNRLCALRMAEARGILIESLARGFQSKGFQLYQRIAGTAMGETGLAYQQFLFSIFDEFALDLSALFDRYSPQGRLFPKETTLLQVLDEINHPDIDPLWAEDETIGWIYQYFNLSEERKMMRSASLAPRNSRELAVRNQFFTPRYVVEFLTDNTLGRLWYEMTQGKTGLLDSCRYLVCRPNEFFLAPKLQNYVLEKDDWVRKVAQTGDFSLLPEDPTLPEIARFALMIDGYDAIRHIESPTHHDNEDDVQKFADRILNPRLRESKKNPKTVWKGSSLELWCCLFMMQRHFWREGFTFSQTRSQSPAFSQQEPALVSLWMDLRKELIASHSEDTQEQLLQQPVYIPYRTVKDPREIRMLDPACGSMHFGLYAFDLFEKIYEEAWDIENGEGINALSRSEDLRPLTQEYPDKEHFLRDVPRLIIERNIHGVDIDPRAAQIAGLSMWLRAQRAWLEQKVRPADRPRICKSNVVCAEPMPGETDMLEEFTATLQPKLLGQLLKIIFEKMKLAGEAGTLLKIEEEIKEAIADAHAEYKKFVLEQNDDENHLPGLAPEREPSLFDFADITRPEDFWKTAESRLIKAIKEYAEQASQNSEQRRLFATDAARGFAFIDICRKKYDFMVMNPPFGSPTPKFFSVLKKTMPDTYTEMYASFVKRGLDLLVPNGRLGAISSRAFLYISRLEIFREKELTDHIDLLLDLAGNVMDNAFVEACCYTVSKSQKYNTLYAWDARKLLQRDSIYGILTKHTCSDSYAFYCVPWGPLSNLPKHKFLYYLPRKISSLLQVKRIFEPEIGTIRQGMGTFFDFRFVHLLWEVPLDNIGLNKQWEPLAKGGPFAKYYGQIHLVVNWENDGKELCEINRQNNGQTAQVRQASDYWRMGGCTYSKRSAKGFSSRALPKGCIMAGKGPAIITQSKITEEYFLGWLNSRLITGLIELQANASEFNTGILKKLPWISPDFETEKKIHELAFNAAIAARKLKKWNESDAYFVFTPILEGDLQKQIDIVRNELVKQKLFVQEADRQITDIIDQLYDVDSSMFLENTQDNLDSDNPDSDDDDSICDQQDGSNIEKEYCHFLISGSLGCAVGRYDIQYATQEKKISIPSPFEQLPMKGLGILQKFSCADYPIDISVSGILVDDSSHDKDIVKALRSVWRLLWKCHSDSIEAQISKTLNVESIRKYLSNPNNFFAYHLATFSGSRRMAPIYWPISTASGSYTLWLYYHRLTSQTLYSCVNDFVEPKLKQTTEETERLQGKANRSSTEERELEKLLDLEQELTDFRDELLRIAQFWKPNLNDGVEITAAPLWKLFRHRQWSARLKETWEKLEAGEYDWAHLALSIWPDRVVRASLKDHSYAIAHDLEDQLWQEVKVTRTGRGGQVTEKIEWHPRKLSEMEIRAVVEEVKKR